MKVVGVFVRFFIAPFSRQSVKRKEYRQVPLSDLQLRTGGHRRVEEP
jgi:hypothetical protein